MSSAPRNITTASAISHFLRLSFLCRRTKYSIFSLLFMVNWVDLNLRGLNSYMLVYQNMARLSQFFSKIITVIVFVKNFLIYFRNT